MEADILKEMIYKRFGIKENELVCPREKSDMTPCICRDGDLAMTENKECVGCGISVFVLLEKEKKLAK